MSAGSMWSPAPGQLLRASPEGNAELFWGLRGGKATLGIITSIEIDLPIPEFYGGALYFDGGDAAAVLHAWWQWSVGLPKSVNTSVALQQLPPLSGVPEPLAGRLTVAVRYAALGDFKAGESLLTPMRSAATPLIDAVGLLPYSAIGAVHSDPVDPMPNFAASLDPGRAARCYSDDARHRLAALADRYDPAGVLCTGQVFRATPKAPDNRS
ncbi:hypothetical protein [Micromonospora sp. WMMD736]|uniref:hypothetical protein n=1 Tax=Micromonospora sp. WMMD736 TaxID=3404112 RepID=UPI003B92D34A